MNIKESIEYFHLLFSARLASKVDRSIFCLKGGCNIRFYFQSIRYSEDIDFDVHTIASQTLKKNVDKILSDGILKSLLKHENIEIVEWSAPKQTETTQRWKVSLKLGGQSLSVPTKIEFSRRNNNFESAEIKPVLQTLVMEYKMQNILLQHYTLHAALEQKINALIHRSETQARDVIDLHILKDKITEKKVFNFSKEEKQQALEALYSVSFDQFKSQVWPFILAEFQDQYKERDVWNRLQEDVANFIQSQVQEK